MTAYPAVSLWSSRLTIARWIIDSLLAGSE
jgi:hypothetical protein